MRTIELKSAVGRLHELHVGRHELDHESLEMVDSFVSFVKLVLIKCSKLTEFSLEFSVTILGQLSLKSLEYDLNTRACYWRPEGC